jgi:ankyrin repeat protein
MAVRDNFIQPVQTSLGNGLLDQSHNPTWAPSITYSKASSYRQFKSTAFSRISSIENQEVLQSPSRLIHKGWENSISSLSSQLSELSIVPANSKEISLGWKSKFLPLSEVECGPSSEDYSDELLLCLTARRKESTLVEKLLKVDDMKVDLEDVFGRTPLSYAAENGDEVVVKLLLDSSKVDVDSKDSYGRTPLSWATQNGHEAVVKLLLDSSKVDADSKDTYRQTPLSWAAQNGHEAVVKLLLETDKVDVDSKDWAELRGMGMRRP